MASLPPDPYGRLSAARGILPEADTQLPVPESNLLQRTVFAPERKAMHQIAELPVKTGFGQNMQRSVFFFCPAGQRGLTHSGMDQQITAHGIKRAEIA